MPTLLTTKFKLISFSIVLILMASSLQCYERTVNSRQKFRHEVRLSIEGKDFVFSNDYVSFVRNQKKIISAKGKDFPGHMSMVVNKSEAGQKLEYDDFIDRFKKQLYLEEFVVSFGGKSYYYRSTNQKFIGKVYHIRRQIYWEFELPLKITDVDSGFTKAKVFFTTHFLKREYPI